MEARLYVPDVLRHVGLDAALTGLQRLAEAELGMSERWPLLYDTDVRYVREPRGMERWLPPSEVLRRGQGDCEDLAAYRAAELNLTGEDPGAEARVVRTGPRTWHAVVLREDGSWEDPSAVLGMHRAGGIAAPMRFRLNPEGDRNYRARVDISGGGWTDRVECVNGDPCAALYDAADLAEQSTLGQLPFIQPFLDIAKNVAQTALNLPSGTKPPPRGAPPQPFDAQQPGSLEDGVLDLARRLKTIAKIEAGRRVARARRSIL